jgi:DNA recombination protein RmuC
MQSFELLVAIAVVLAIAAVLVAITLFRVAALRAASGAAAGAAADLRTRLDVLAAQSAGMERDLKQELANARAEQTAAAQAVRTELGAHLAQLTQTLQQQLASGGAAQVQQLREIGDRLLQLTHANDQRLEAVRATVEEKLDVLRAENAWKLEQMRATVDEKLQSTLETRLGESFKQVSERLEQVHRGLGEMQNLAAGVGDLKRVLGNVKTRGGWGEVQLAALLSELLTPQQYDTNVETRRGSGERVEFAIRLPGRGDDGAPCWLPTTVSHEAPTRANSIVGEERPNPGEDPTTRLVLPPAPDEEPAEQPGEKTTVDVGVSKRAMTVTSLERPADEAADDTRQLTPPPIPAQRRPSPDET